MVNQSFAVWDPTATADSTGQTVAGGAARPIGNIGASGAFFLGVFQGQNPLSSPIDNEIGTRRSLQIFLAEDSFTASQAYAWGLVAKVVPAVELKAATRQFAERLAQNPPSAIAGTKALVYQAVVTPTRQQLDAEEANIIAAMQTDDFKVAVKRFTSKAKPA